jgi:hypothetical protein
MENNSKHLENIIVDDKIFIIRGIQVMVDKKWKKWGRVQLNYKK